MKKISESHYCWLVGMNKRIWSKRGGRSKRNLTRRHSPRHVKLLHPLLLPSALSLDSVEDFDALVQAVSALRHRIKSPRFDPIDFRPIQKITPSGALILAAEIDRIRRKRQMKMRPWCESEWHPAVKKIFSQFKLFELLNISRKEEEHEFEHTKFVPLIYGKRAQGELAISLQEKLEKIVGEPLEKKHWFVALTEAMTNVAQHAYPAPQKDIDIYQAWWLSGSFNKQTSLLTVMFYDQGVTIPGSLPQSKIWGAIKALISSGSTDGEQIDAAFEVGRSRTKETHRGKGVAQLLYPINACVKGSLRIISRHGVYVSHCENSQFRREFSNYNTALEGTFIEWKLYLNYGGEHDSC